MIGVARKPFDSDYGYLQSASYLNVSGEKLRVSIAWVSAKSQADLHYVALDSEGRQKYLDSVYAKEPFLKQLPSGLPPGFARVTKGTSISLKVLSDFAEVTCYFTPQILTTSKGFADPQSFDFKSKSTLLERIARHTLANAAGLRLEDIGTGVVASGEIIRSSCRRTGRVFGDLSQWAGLAGWTIAEDKHYGVLNLKKGANWAVIPLGSDQIKVKGVWKEMGDSAAFFKGKLYLPAAGLEHLRNL